MSPKGLQLAKLEVLESMLLSMPVLPCPGFALPVSMLALVAGQAGASLSRHSFGVESVRRHSVCRGLCCDHALSGCQRQGAQYHIMLESAVRLMGTQIPASRTLHKGRSCQAAAVHAEVS